MDLLRDSYKYSYISSATSTDVTGSGAVPVTAKLIRIIVGTTAAGTIAVYDALGAATTTQVAELQASAEVGTYEFGVTFARGIQIVTGAASKITVVWSRV